MWKTLPPTGLKNDRFMIYISIDNN